MALAGDESAHSVTELCMSPVYHYEYGSIGKTIGYLAKDNIGTRTNQTIDSAVLYGLLPETGSRLAVY